MKREAQIAGVACLLIAAVTWGAGFAVGKAAMRAVDAYFLTTIRYGTAVSVFLAWLAHAEGRASLSCEGRVGRIVLLGIVGIGGGVLLMFIGLHRTRAEHAAVIVATQPLAAALATMVLRGRRPAPRTVLAIALALAGVTLVVTRGDPATLLEGGGAAGDLMVLSAALCWVTYTLGAASFPHWSALRYTALTGSAGALFVLAATAAALPFGAALVPSAAQLLSVGWEILFVTFGAAMLGTLCWNVGIRRIGESGVLFINFVPITAFAIGVAQGYRFNWAEMLGALLVVTGLFVNRFAAARVAAPAAQPGRAE